MQNNEPTVTLARGTGKYKNADDLDLVLSNIEIVQKLGGVAELGNGLF